MFDIFWMFNYHQDVNPNQCWNECWEVYIYIYIYDVERYACNAFERYTYDNVERYIINYICSNVEEYMWQYWYIHVLILRDRHL